MPLYSLRCDNKHKEDKFLTFEQYDLSAFGDCTTCAGALRPVAANKICVYGTVKYHDKALADASEAAGRRISSTKDADAAEANGEMYRITNPSAHRRTKAERDRERNRVWKEKLAREF